MMRSFQNTNYWLFVLKESRRRTFCGTIRMMTEQDRYESRRRYRARARRVHTSPTSLTPHLHQDLPIKRKQAVTVELNNTRTNQSSCETWPAAAWEYHRLSAREEHTSSIGPTDIFDIINNHRMLHLSRIEESVQTLRTLLDVVQ